MVTLSRRTLLGSTLAVVGSLALDTTFFDRALAAARADNPAEATPRTLIVIQLAGGNDGLNTVVPYADDRYRALRPNLGLEPAAVHRLDAELGLHPALAGLKGIWDAGELAIVEGVGYQNPSLSHFQAMDIWQSADPSHGRRSGWLAKAVEGVVDSQGHPFGAVALGTAVPPALCCPPTPAAVVEKADSYRLLRDGAYPRLGAARDDALKRLYASYQSATPYAALFENIQAGTEVGMAQLQRAIGGYVPAAPYPSTPLADGLKLFAAMIDGGIGLRIGYVVLGGFDTHATQKDRHARLLTTLDGAIGGFLADLKAKGHDQDVLTLTWSEFGRRPTENASGGTDHGTAAPMFLVGGAVKGGLYGDRPDLARLQGGNLPYAVDFRSVYASVLEGWLGADATAVLGQRFPTLPLLRT